MSNSVYRERAHFVAHLATVYPAILAPGADPSEPDWPVLFVQTPRGQMSWHISPDDTDLFEHVPVRAGESVWDGHTTEEKYERLRQLTADRDHA
ncbi:WDGH domain-containing protein [Streptomyces olivaceus]|uniref:WDGH domain-containing protein n=1 Tax=Streptomyces olivaceus TaxID=47716 RepID=UPI00378C0EE3